MTDETTSDAEASTDEQPADDTRTSSSRGGRLRRIAAALLIVLASVLLFGTAADVWLKNQVLSTSQWVKASDEVLAQPKVQAALSDYIVDEIYSNVDVQKEMSDLLPENFKGMSGPIAGALRAPATTAVEKILASNQVRRIWHDVNTKAHTALVDVLEDKGTYVSTANGKVVLDLGELVRVVGTQLGLPSAVMDKVPADAGQITLFESSNLALVQNAVKMVRILGPILAVVILALYAAAVWINRGRRRVTLRNVGWSIIIVGIVLTTTRRILGNLVGGSITDPTYSAAAKVIVAILSRLLYDTAWVLITWGIVIIIGTFLVGPSRAAVALRRLVAPVFNLDRTVFWGASAVVYLLVLLWSPSPAFRLWWSIIVIAIVVGLGFEYLRRMIAVEFPDRRFDAEFDGLRAGGSRAWAGVTGWVEGLRHHDGEGAATGDPAEQLQRLTAMHATGALSDDEFSAAKAKILG